MTGPLGGTAAPADADAPVAVRADAPVAVRMDGAASTDATESVENRALTPLAFLGPAGATCEGDSCSF